LSGNKNGGTRLFNLFGNNKKSQLERTNDFAFAHDQAQLLLTHEAGDVNFKDFASKSHGVVNFLQQP